MVNVLHKPDCVVTKEEDSTGDIVLTCEAIAAPPVLSFSWYAALSHSLALPLFILLFLEITSSSGRLSGRDRPSVKSGKRCEPTS